MATITAIRTSVVCVTRRTNWVFVLVDDDEGRTGVGEATCDGHEPQVLASVDAARRRFVGQPALPLAHLTRPHPMAFGGLAHAAANSAIEQALWDLVGQRLGAPVSDLLGGAAAPAVRAYANVNRSLLTDRSPDAFARAARESVAAGFDAVKVAAFDGLRWEPEEDRRGGALIASGLDRLHAVREAIGPDVDLLIECHFRFDARTAVAVMPRLAALRPYWIEAPVSERDLEGWRRVRDATDARLAGGEVIVGQAAHRRFIQASGVDVIMADVKYCGGIAGLMAVGALADADSIQLAPHNPSGPVSTAATAHVAAVLPHVVTIMEFAWGEADWRASLVGGAEVVDGGRVRVPTGPGLGIALDETLAAAHPYRETPVAPDLWER
jgi:galactonate dehydratase